MAYIAKPEVDMFNTNCEEMTQCIPQETIIRNVRLAAAYVPYQKLCTTFSPIQSLKAGTIFPELFSPYEKKNKKNKFNREEV